MDRTYLLPLSVVSLLGWNSAYQRLVFKYKLMDLSTYNNQDQPVSLRHISL